MSTSIRGIAGFAATVFSLFACTGAPARQAFAQSDSIRSGETATLPGLNAFGRLQRSVPPFAAAASDVSLFSPAGSIDRTPNRTEGEVIGAGRTLLDFGLDGTGVVIGLWDIGHPYDHLEFGSQVVLGDADQTGRSDHATHVCGTLIASGVDDLARGLAPGATVRVFDVLGDDMEMQTQSNPSRQGLRVSNHSYVVSDIGWKKTAPGEAVEWTYFGSSEQFGSYSDKTWYWDTILWMRRNYLAVKAAGNDGGEGPSEAGTPHHHGSSSAIYTDFHPIDCADGRGCLGKVSASKNALVIGALNAAGLSPLPMSSRGPTVDGRIKPDLMAVGESVYSTVGEDLYATSSGTSHATPMVTASVALVLQMEERLRPDSRLLSSTMKALLIHTADDIGSSGPDYASGWGRVNVEAAVALMEYDHETGRRSILQPVVSDTFEVTVGTNGESIRATLAWIDARGPDPLNHPDRPAVELVNDFDLEISLDDRTWYPWVLDPALPLAPAATGRNIRDNVEQVVVPPGYAGNARIRVIAPPGVSDQVSLVVTLGGKAVGTAIEPSEPPAVGSSLPTQGRQVDIFPNPAVSGELLHIDSRQTIERIELYDAVGRRVAVREGVGNVFDIPSSVAPGVYFLRMMTSSGPVSKQVVVRR